MITRILITYFIFVFPFLSVGQDAFYFDEEGNDHRIMRSTPQDIIDKYLEQNDFKAIEFNPRKESQYTFRVKTKKGDWRLCDSIYTEFHWAENYSIHFPNELMEKIGVFTAERGKKNFFFSPWINEPIEEVWYNEIKAIHIMDSISNPDYEMNKTDEDYVFAIRQKKKWSIVYLDIARDEGEPVYRLTPFCFDSYQELPIERAKEYVRKADEFRSKGLPLLFYDLEELYTYKEIEDIEFDTTDIYSFPRLKDKKGDWYLYDAYNQQLIGEKGYSLGFDHYKCGYYTTAEKKGEKYFYSLGEDGQGVIEEISFDKIKEHFAIHESEVFDPESADVKVDDQGEIVTRTDEYCDFVMVSKDDKWAMVYYDESVKRPYQLTGFHFSSYENLPDSILESYIYSSDGFGNIEYNNEALEGASHIANSNTDLDIILFEGYVNLASYGDQLLYRVRHAETKRWSYLIHGEFPSTTELPTAASSISSYEYGNSIGVIEVWCDDKVGYYFYDGENIKMIKGCEYDDFQYVFLDATYGCALKKNGKWELFKMDAPEKLVEGNAETIDGLIELWLNR